MCKVNSIKGPACLEAFSQKESKMGILPLNRDKIYVKSNFVIYLR